MKKSKIDNIAKNDPAAAGCQDKKCPFHGNILVKREQRQGTLIKKDSNRSATIEWERQYYVQKYERYEKRRSRLHVHNPQCIGAGIGDVVRVTRTRPLSKTKFFAIVEIVAKKGAVKVQT
jgi:small subunit ribosomal protein S17